MSPNLAQCVVLLWIRLILYDLHPIFDGPLSTFLHPVLASSYTLWQDFSKRASFPIVCVDWFYDKAVWGVVKSWEFEGNLRCSKMLRIWKFAEKGFVLFTRILGLLWHDLKKILRIRIRKIERLFPGANLVLRLKWRSKISFATFQWKETFELWAWALKELSKMSSHMGLASVLAFGTLSSFLT